jgi:hypothetical protein
VRRLETPEACMVAWDGSRVLGVDWRGRRRLVDRTLEVWAYRSAWWKDATLIGERREYHTVVTQLGALELLCHVSPESRTWFVAAVWD